MDVHGTCPLPEEPALNEVARAMRDTRQWGVLVDSQWRVVYATDDIRLTESGGVELAPHPIGVHLFAPEAVSLFPGWRFGMNTLEFFREGFPAVGRLVLPRTPRGRDGVRAPGHPRLPCP